MFVGLDAATTYDITRLMGQAARWGNSIKVVSLLQPPPETVALFDEVILLDRGRVIFAGPIDEVVGHFTGLGYKIPPRMDPADWLQTLPTPDGSNFLVDDKQKHLTMKNSSKKSYSPKEANSSPSDSRLHCLRASSRSRERRNSRNNSTTLGGNQPSLCFGERPCSGGETSRPTSSRLGEM